MPVNEPEQQPEATLAAQLAELASRPVGETRADRLRARLLELAQRATTWGPLAPVAEVGWRTLRRDASIGGSVLGAALAYRLFIWLLPFALVLVLGLGIAARRVEESTADILRDAGLTGFIAASISESSERASGWGAVVALIGALIVLLYQSAALLRAARAVTALAWRLPVRPPASTARATLLFLGWIVAFVVVVSSASPLRRALAFPLDLLVSLAVYTALPALYLVLAWALLPHGAERWRELVPGAVLFGVGVACIGLFNALFLFPWLAEREATYGVLGVAAGLLFGFFLFGRTVELAAALNAELAESRRRRTLAR
jgi:membrane protein